MRRLMVLAACCGGLFACSKSFNPATVGQTGSSMTCSGMALAVRACVVQSGRSCASGHYVVYDQGVGNQIGDDRTGIADQFLSVVQATGARVVCTPPSTTPSLSSPPANLSMPPGNLSAPPSP